MDEKQSFTVLGADDKRIPHSLPFTKKITMKYDALIQTFGLPDPEAGDTYKSDAVWSILFNDGKFVSIYNYKNGNAYLDIDGTPTKDIVTWRLSGSDDGLVERILKLIDDPRTTPKIEKLAPKGYAAEILFVSLFGTLSPDIIAGLRKDGVHLLPPGKQYLAFAEILTASS